VAKRIAILIAALWGLEGTIVRAQQSPLEITGYGGIGYGSTGYHSPGVPSQQWGELTS